MIYHNCLRKGTKLNLCAEAVNCDWFLNNLITKEERKAT